RRATSGQHRLKHEVTAKASSATVVIRCKDSNAQRIFLSQSRKNAAIQLIKRVFRHREKLCMDTLCSLDEFPSVDLELIFTRTKQSHIRRGQIIAACIKDDLVNGIDVAKFLQQRKFVSKLPPTDSEIVDAHITVTATS